MHKAVMSDQLLFGFHFWLSFSGMVLGLEMSFQDNWGQL